MDRTLDMTLGTKFPRMGAHGRRKPLVLTLAAMLLVLAGPAATPASAALCPDVPHSSDPVELDCASANERWAVIDATTGLVTNVVGWNGTNKWRPPVGQFAKDLPDGSPVGPGWWYVDGTFIRDSFERNVTATARILGVELRWSTGGLGTDTGDVTFTIDVAPTGQQFTTSSSSLLIDPLEAGVAHTFTVTATRSDGSTVQGPVVTATPEVDPDPDCTDHSVARECRAATDWAVVDPDTMLVANVIVCTPWQCGADGEWRGRMPTDTSWPNFLLIELRGRGGIGWQYVDGTFVDVRPREEPEEFTPSPPAPEPTDEATGATDATDATTGGSAETDEVDADPAPAETPADATDAPDTEAPVTGEDPTAASSSGPTAATSDDDAAATDADEPVATTDATIEPEPAQGPIRRVVSGIVSFLRGLFGN